MNANAILALVAAICLLTITSTQAEVTFKCDGLTYFPSTQEQRFRLYNDLGDRTADPQSIRESYLLLNNQISAIGQFNWEAFRQPIKICIKSGIATYSIGEGSNMSTTSVSFLGTERENALYIDIFAQSAMNPYSPERGIKLEVSKVNGTVINGSLSGTFSYPQSGTGDYGVLYGFSSINNLTVEGWVEMINPALITNPFDYAFSIGTGHTDLGSVPEPTSLTLLLGVASLIFLKRRTFRHPCNSDPPELID